MADQKKRVTSFFFFRGNPDRNTALKLWPTLAYQIAALDEKVKKRIGAMVTNTPDIFSKTLASQLEGLIVEPLGSSKRYRWLHPWRKFERWPRDRILVIIDGLDECKSEEDQCAIVSSISRIIHKHRLPLRFLIASRPEPHIRHSFENRDLQRMCYPIFLDESFNPVHDVHVYLRSEFDKLRTKYAHTIESESDSEPWPSNNVVQLLADKSSGQFIYASTVLKFVDNEDCRPEDQLEVVLDASRVTASTENPFAALDQLYRQILATSKNRTLLLRILGCILVAPESLRAVDIEHLLSLRKGDVGLTLRRIHSLLYVPRENGRSIYVYHKSLADFLFNPRAGDYYMELERCHLDLARCCFRILRSPPKNYLIQ